jgi:hypothetical protein
VPAPQSGSIALNGKAVAEQIGAQIFIDGWAMVSPGNPEQAVYLAGEAGRVSHDGESVHAAQLLAAMEAQAFVESDVQKLLDVGLSFVPKDALIRRVVGDVRDWHAGDNSNDWERTRALIAERYGYDKFPGNCHVVPNHALVILATLYGQHSFQEAMRIANTAGWDTDCNAGNVGCLFGIRKGLEGIDAGADFRTPVADRMYISSADGGGSITDAVIETRALVEAGHALAGVPLPAAAKQGARFGFEFAGSLQGFRCEAGSPAHLHPVDLKNVDHSRLGHRSLAIRFDRLAPGRVARVSSPTFFDKEVFGMPIYQLQASPTLYSGQTVACGLAAGAANTAGVVVRLYASVFDAKDELTRIYGPAQHVGPDGGAVLRWRIPDTESYPIYDIGLQLETADVAGVDGVIYLDYLRWDGAPDITLRRPDTESVMWKHAWVDDVSHFQTRWEGLRVTSNAGLGSLAQGTREWTDYVVETEVTPLLARRWGVAVRVQGRERYYALMFDSREGGSHVSLVRRCHLETELASERFAWELDRPYRLRLDVQGRTLRASIDDRLVFQTEDPDGQLRGGGVGLLVDTGSISTREVRVRPL